MNGTRLAAVWGNDYEGFRQKAMSDANLIPNGTPDTATNSQLLDAIDVRYRSSGWVPTVTEIGAAPSSHVGSTGSAHGVATTSVAGFMSADDKTKLDGISGDNTGDQTITLTGDVTGSGTGSFATTLANSGVTTGTYKSVTVDAKGRVTAGTNPTTLAEYGITDAAPSSHVGATGTAHGLATTSVNGFMSAADKTKLDGLGSGGAATNADRLTTPRNINGTSFDGTSNIVTANWGASRTITIGGVSKTVNGGSDVSWSTSELGFLPTSGGTMTGTLTLYGQPLRVSQGSGYSNYFHVHMDDGVPTISTQVGTSGFKVMTGSSLVKFLVNESGELYANGVHRVYHTNNKPTATDVGLGNVNNTSDLDKPISTATQAALDSKEATIALGTTAQYWRGDKSWQSLNKAAVGLGNVNDTSDLNKPISTATQTALNAKYSPSNRPTPADIGALPAAGTAVAATKLATARTIAGKSFDGTANISITAADVGALPASGGTLSGGLITSSTIKLADTSATDTSGLLNPFGRTIVRGSTIAANVFGNYTDAMFLYGNSLTAWQVRYNNISYPIYHTGNKPTPAEIGAQPATSDIRVKSNIESLAPVLDKVMLIDPKTFTMEGREGTCVGTIAQDWEVDFPEVILNVPSTTQGEPEMLKGIDALGTIGILLKAIQELKGELENLKNR